MVFKRLQLITPELANKLGIPAESPVFVSPNVREAEFCADCNTVYTPLVYQAGYTVMAQHFHESGGIYSYNLRDFESRRVFTNIYYGTGFVNCYGFMAIAETVGLFVAEEEFSPVVVRSKGVQVREIRPFSSNPRISFKSTEVLSQTEGFLIYDSNFLYPRQYGHPINDRYPPVFTRYKYDFKQTEKGEVVFTAPNSNYQYRDYKLERNTKTSDGFHLF